MAFLRYSCCGLVVFAFVTGCKTTQPVCDPEFTRLSRSVQQASYAAPASLVGPVLPELEGPHPVEVYVRYALLQNPEIQAARNRMEALAHQVPVAASLPDPMLNVTMQPESVQTAAGEQDLILSANQKLHTFGKLEMRAKIAESKTNIARAQLAAVELATIARVKKAYYELYFIQRSIDITREDQQSLSEILDLADKRYQTQLTNYQDVLRADLEISTTKNELVQLQQRLASAQAKLARMLHVAPTTKLLAVKNLGSEQVPKNLEFLQQQAIAARPELHAQLSAIQRDRQTVALARLDFKPDVTVGFSWIDVANSGISPVANGRDAFLISAGVNLPVYRKRLSSAVRSAQATAVTSAREYDALRDATLEQVTDLFTQAHSQQEMLTIFSREILPKSQDVLESSQRGYDVGEVDFLQLIDNWRQLLRYEINYRRLETSLRQTLAELERVVGGMERNANPRTPVPAKELQDLPPLPVE